MAQNTIAIVADCDDTLGPDTTAQLLSSFGVDPEEFFHEASALVREGWDPILAYLYRMIRLAQDDGPLSGLTREKIAELGQSLGFYPGVPSLFAKLKQEIESEPSYRDAGIRVECYVVSSGLEQLLAASPLAGELHALWGCSFDFDARGRISFP